MKILGIEFAPLNIPLSRRLQTLCCFQWVLTFMFGGFGCLFVAIFLLFTRLWWIPCLYFLWYLYDKDAADTGARPNETVRRCAVWKYMADFYPAKLHKTVDLDPKRSYILGLHPHGIMHASGFLTFATEGTGFSEQFPGMYPHLATLPGQFMFPFYRDYLLTSGTVSASKASFKWMLTHPGHMACVVVGGAIEALDSKPGNYNMRILKRKGFIKQALVYGAPLVPVYHFGEQDMFDQTSNPEGSFLRKLQLLLMKVCGFSLPIPMARGIFQYNFGLVPYRGPINTWIGAPINVEKTENPSQKEIDDLHAKYVQELENLFEKHKSKHGIADDVHLNILA